MANPNFSKEELSCIAEVQKAPEWEQEWVFKKACKKLTLEAKSKLEILLFAWALLATPVMANDTANCQSFNSVEQSLSCNPKYKEYKKLQKTNPAEEQNILQESILNIYNNDFLVGFSESRGKRYKKSFESYSLDIQKLLLNLYLEWKKYIKWSENINDFKIDLSAIISKITSKNTWAKEIVDNILKQNPDIINTTFWIKIINLAQEIDRIWKEEINNLNSEIQYYKKIQEFRWNMAKKFN